MKSRSRQMPVFTLFWAMPVYGVAMTTPEHDPLHVVLHVGAHRTATTSLQSLMRQNERALLAAGVSFWEPEQTRSGLFGGLFRHPKRITRDVHRRGRRSAGRARMRIDAQEQVGLTRLIVSEENMIGCMADNLLSSRLYPQAADRLMRFAPCFAGREVTIGLAIRSYDRYWASSLAHALQRGRVTPAPSLFDCLVTQPRRWRDLARDLTEVFPRAKLLVWPFEAFAGQPEAVLSALAPETAGLTLRHTRAWHNASPTCETLRKKLAERGAAGPAITGHGRWQPFDNDHIAAFRAAYREDLAWFRDAAPASIQFMPDAQAHGRWMTETRGRPHDIAEGRMAQTG